MLYTLPPESYHLIYHEPITTAIRPTDELNPSPD